MKILEMINKTKTKIEEENVKNNIDKPLDEFLNLYESNPKE